MAHQIINLQGGTIDADSQSGAGTIMERDTNGDSFANGYNASTYLKTLGELFAKGRSYTTTQTLDHTLNATTVVKLDATAGAFNLTLPAATSCTNQLYAFVKIDSGTNVPTIKGSGSENINGANTYTGLSAQYKTAVLWCDGTQWFILAKI